MEINEIKMPDEVDINSIIEYTENLKKDLNASEVEIGFGVTINEEGKMTTVNFKARWRHPKDKYADDPVLARKTNQKNEKTMKDLETRLRSNGWYIEWAGREINIAPDSYELEMFELNATKEVEVE